MREWQSSKTPVQTVDQEFLPAFKFYFMIPQKHSPERVGHVRKNYDSALSGL
jgi:hypothetical protein